MLYADRTYRTTEPLKRLVHAPRIRQILDRIARPDPADMVLDYGCGDAYLLGQFVGKMPRDQLYGFDPSPNMQEQIAPEIRAGAHIQDLKALLSQKAGAFTLIYCIEVCEHLPPGFLDRLLANLATLAAPGARIVIGVPIETGLPGFVKTLYRAVYRRHEASFAKAWRALWGLPIERVGPGNWYSSHIGFDHRRLRATIEARGFRIERIAHLPSSWTGAALNNEIYFICSRRT